MASYEDMFNWLCNFIGEVTILSSFNGHRSCDSRDITDLIFHVTLQDHLIKRGRDFMEGSSSLYIPTLSTLVVTSVVIADM